MFTGIIEDLGRVLDLEKQGTNLRLKIESKISEELKVDQSVAHNGVCLTVVMVEAGVHYLDVIEETLNRSCLGSLKLGDIVNLERATALGSRLDGHMVQGHVDGSAKLVKREERDGSWEFRFDYDESTEPITIPKGSICVNGISLTLMNEDEQGFQVAIIPYTFENTNLSKLQIGHSVNIEFDMVGKYIKKFVSN